jgi:hypothetical protein
VVTWVRKTLVFVLERVEEFPGGHFHWVNAVLWGRKTVSLQTIILVFSLVWRCECCHAFNLGGFAFVIICLFFMFMTSLLHLNITNWHNSCSSCLNSDRFTWNSGELFLFQLRWGSVWISARNTQNFSNFLTQLIHPWNSST